MPDGEGIRFYQVDAFTDVAYRGNPAAVCVLEEALSADRMQAIAAEMNLSETAFVEPPGEDGTRRLRWFTPTTEVPLCGHATLATAHVLVREAEAEGAEVADESRLRFETASGSVAVEVEEDGALTLDFPADPPVEAEPPPELREALGVPPDAPAARGGKVWVVRLPDEDAVRALRPSRDLGSVRIEQGILGVAVTARGRAADFVSRFFAPWVGVDEDPVTGVAHTALGPYWAEALGSGPLLARQLSRRGGEMHVQVAGERVRLTGHAVTVARGTLVAPRK